MSNKTLLATTNLCLAIATLSMMMAAGPCAAATDAATTAAAPATAASQPANGEVQTLDEIRVYGESLVRRINDAESAFFPLYNKLNKDEDYDIACGFISMRPGSMIMNRICVPGFVADYSPVPASDPGMCMAASSTPTADGTAYYASLPCYGTGYVPPPVDLVIMARSRDLYRHMMRTVLSDSRLTEMAGNLDDLYHEMDSVQHHFVKVKDANRKPGKSNAGPRAL